MKRLLGLVMFVTLAATAVADERVAVLSRSEQAGAGSDRFVPTVFPSVAIDQTRRPTDVGTNLQNDFDDWWDQAGGVDICVNPQSTVQADKKCTFDPAAPEIKFCTTSIAKFCREVNVGSVAQKCKTCPR